MLCVHASDSDCLKDLPVHNMYMYHVFTSCMNIVNYSSALSCIRVFRSRCLWELHRLIILARAQMYGYTVWKIPSVAFNPAIWESSITWCKSFDPSCENVSIAEFKCPYAKRDVSPLEACADTNFYGELVNGHFQLKHDNYFHQVQLQLYVSEDMQFLWLLRLHSCRYSCRKKIPM